jgi:NAD(P)-dependent dehydrogenase (short-subunit alcohol dehydrogenase family)
MIVMIAIMEELKGKVVIITGGNRGIGAGCATAFCGCGCHVVIAGRDKQLGDSFAAGLSKSESGTCTFFQCDVSKPGQVEELVAFSVDNFERLDCCINNAGYLPKRGQIDEISTADFEEVLSTNLIGVFSGCKYSLPHLRNTKGSIINMSSILGVVGHGGSSIYTATKGAIISLTKSLAIDEAKNDVRVNAVIPGNIRTEVGKRNRNPSLNRKQAEEITKRWQWIRRKGMPIEIGWTCVFLASPMASYITGAEIYATGGYELGNGLRMSSQEVAEIFSNR